VSGVVWLSVLTPALAIGFYLGYLVGRDAEVQRRVDAVLRRETRLRHPAGRAK
jgi:hypothetical protein